jgi:Protein of unknown function (DUF3277)
MKNYAFQAVTGVFTHPLLTPFQFFGQFGAGEFIVTMATERTAQDIGADGTVVQSGIAGRNGHLEIQMQQNSIFHDYLLSWFNQIEAQLNAGGTGAQYWAAAAVTIIDQLSGHSHILTGVSPSVIPGKTYAAQAGRFVWRLVAADIANN